MLARGRAGSLLFGVLIFAALFLGFRWNVWRAAGPAFFAHAQKDTQGLVLGRLAASRALGFFSNAGLLGFVGDRPEVLTLDTAVLYRAYRPLNQARIYVTESPFRSFGPFFSHSGLQGSAFALLDRALGFLEPRTRLSLFFTLTAALFAAAHAVVVVLLWREFGMCAALPALAAVLASPWLTALGRNLYFSLWLFWLPPLAIGAVLARRAGRRGEGRWLAGVVFLAFLARCLSGYEFMTAGVALAGAAVLYYSFRDAVGVRVFLVRAGIASGASALALALSLGILTLQIGWVTGSTSHASRHVEIAIARRTHGDPSRLPPAYARSLQVDTGRVVRTFLEDPFDREAKAKPRPFRWLLDRSYRDLILVVLAAALWIAVRGPWLPRERRLRALGLVSATAVTLAGVLSWLTIFKAHSADHPHVSPLLWHLGFSLFGAALVGVAAADALKLLVRAARRRAVGEQLPTEDSRSVPR